MPGQFILQYYVDNTAKKLKGSVDLDQCEQVDSGLTFECGKLRFQYMFDIRTPRRVYYLAADTEEEMFQLGGPGVSRLRPPQLLREPR